MADRRKRSSSPSPDCSSLDNGPAGHSLDSSHHDHFHTTGGHGGGGSYHGTHHPFHFGSNKAGGDPPGHGGTTTTTPSDHSTPMKDHDSKSSFLPPPSSNNNEQGGGVSTTAPAGNNTIPPFPGPGGPGPASFGTPPNMTWNDCYIQLAAFKQSHGHANPTSGNLANWLACQRLLFTQGAHPNSMQVKLLRQMGCFGFGSDGPSRQPHQMQLPTHHQGGSTGNTTIPPFPGGPFPSSSTGTTSAGGGGGGIAQLPPLTATTVGTTSGGAKKRSKSSSKKKSSSSSVASLPPLVLPVRGGGPGSIAAAVAGSMTWDDRFEQLVAYKKSHGNNPNPPQTKGSPEADYKLAIWLNSQRQKFRKGTLDQDKLFRLQHLGCEGFKITSPSASALAAAAAAASSAASKTKKRRSMPPLKKKGKASSAVAAKKSQSSKAKKPPPRKKVCWNDRYLELKAFKEKVGHANPNYGKGTKDSCKHLAQWLSNQRSDFRLGKKISNEQAKLLRDLGSRGFELENQKAPARSRK